MSEVRSDGPSIDMQEKIDTFLEKVKDLPPCQISKHFFVKIEDAVVCRHCGWRI